MITTRLKLIGIAGFAVAVLGLVGLIGTTETASADPHPPIAAACAAFGIPEDECASGALILEATCNVPSSALTTPSSSLESYDGYLDIDAIHASGLPGLDGDGLGDLDSGVNAPGGIRLEFTPSGNVNVQCDFDVSHFMLDDAPNGALVTEFICGPGPFFQADHGTSRLTPNGKLKINCHFSGWPPTG